MIPAVDAGAPYTLAIDIGGTGLKAAVLDANGKLVGQRARIPTTYPCPPRLLVAMLVKLTQSLPPFERVTAGFPGMVREGKILSAPHFVTKAGPGTEISKKLTAEWAAFDLAKALEKATGKPTRVANDADVQGAAVIKGKGLELVLTLGTGFGTALFWNGKLMPHLELAHHPFRKGLTYNEVVGERARRQVGNKRWKKRVQKAIDQMRALTFFDHCFVGGGNAARLSRVDPDVTLIDNAAGIEGGIALWKV